MDFRGQYQDENTRMAGNDIQAKSLSLTRLLSDARMRAGFRDCMTSLPGAHAYAGEKSNVLG